MSEAFDASISMDRGSYAHVNSCASLQATTHTDLGAGRDDPIPCGALGVGRVQPPRSAQQPILAHKKALSKRPSARQQLTAAHFKA
jgi:hypothetical protein